MNEYKNSLVRTFSHIFIFIPIYAVGREYIHNRVRNVRKAVSV
jgi:hypothetical protein